MQNAMRNALINLRPSTLNDTLIGCWLTITLAFHSFPDVTWG